MAGSSTPGHEADGGLSYARQVRLRWTQTPHTHTPSPREARFTLASKVHANVVVQHLLICMIFVGLYIVFAPNTSIRRQLAGPLI